MHKYSKALLRRISFHIHTHTCASLQYTHTHLHVARSHILRDLGLSLQSHDAYRALQVFSQEQAARELSPLFRLGRLRSPLLLIHGEKDPRVPRVRRRQGW